MGKRHVIIGLIALAAAGAFGLQATGKWSTAYSWLSQNLPGTVGAQQPAGNEAKAKDGKGKDAKAGGSGGAGRGPAPVEVAEARSQTLQDSISVIGSLAARESVTIASDTAGRIVTVSAVDGASVKAGDALFTLDGALLAAEMKDAEARLALAQTNFERNQSLLKSRNVPQSTVDQSKAELDLARSAMELVREKQNRLVVRAPFDGYLGFRQVSVGAFVNAGMPLVSLDQINTLKVSFSVPERYFTSLSVGQKVSVAADAVPGETFDAGITAISPVVDTNGRALQVQAALDNGKLALRPGMLVRATVLGQSREAITVSEAAIVPQGRDNAVFTVKDGKAVRQVVTTGQRRDGWVEITSGLAAGAQVVSAGATRLSDGAAVKVAGAAATE